MENNINLYRKSDRSDVYWGSEIRETGFAELGEPRRSIEVGGVLQARVEDTRGVERETGCCATGRKITRARSLVRSELGLDQLDQSVEPLLISFPVTGYLVFATIQPPVQAPEPLRRRHEYLRGFVIKKKKKNIIIKNTLVARGFFGWEKEVLEREEKKGKTRLEG